MSSPHRRRSLSNRVMGLTGLVMSLLVALHAGMTYWHNRQLEDAGLREQLRLLLSDRVTAAQLSPALVEGEPPQGLIAPLPLSGAQALLLDSNGRSLLPPSTAPTRLVDLVRTLTPHSEASVLAVDGGRYYLAVAYLPEPGWRYAIAYPKERLSGRALAATRPILLTDLLLLALGLSLLAWILRAEVRRPLTQLLAGIRALAQGQPLSHSRLPLDREDELGDFARRFAELAAQIDDRNRHLQERNATLAQEVQERRQREEAMRQLTEKLRSATQAAFMGVWDYDLVRKELVWDEQMYRLYGIRPDEFNNSLRDWQDLVHPDDRNKVDEAVNAAIQGNTPYQNVQFRILQPEGTLRYIAGFGQVLRDAAGNPLRFVGVNVDITEQKLAESRILHMATHDTLTGLANRHLLNTRLHKAIANAAARNQKVAVMFLDLDRFKNINDSYGHGTGDEVLKIVAQRLLNMVGQHDTLARLGGDEFLIVLAGLREEERALQELDKILQQISRPMTYARHDFTVTPSIGICFYPDDGLDPETLVRNADTALYRAKAAGRGTWCRYRREMSVETSERMALEQAMYQALTQHEFLLHYQPKVCARTHRLLGAEALVRWQRPGIGLVPPGKFIPIAEESGLIAPLGAWVIEETCRQLDAWRQQGLPLIRVAVNLSAAQLRLQNIETTVQDALARYQLPPDCLEMEVTESLLMQDDAHGVADMLRRLKELGVTLAIDDFGTGYSSLSYLHRFPFDTLKIDRAFIQTIEALEDDAPIVRTVISLSHGLGLTTVAEGVETRTQLQWLRRHNCDQIQGYVFCPPVSADRFEAILREGTMAPAQ